MYNHSSLKKSLVSASLILMASSAHSAAYPQDQGPTSVNEVRMAEPKELVLARAMPHLQAITQANVEIWGQDGASWTVDLDRGVIEFTNQKGMLISAPVQVIGTYDTRDGSFMWGWDHPSVPSESAVAANAVKRFATRHALKNTSDVLVNISEQEAWEFTALAAYLTDAQGAYRGPAGTTLVFMTFGKVRISKP